MPRVTVPETGAGPHATVSLIAVLSPGAGSARPGDRWTATGRLPAGAGPLPCSQYLVKIGCAGSGAFPLASTDVPGAEMPGPSVEADTAEAAEAELTELTGDLEVSPGGRAEIAVRLVNNTASELRGEAQLISSHGSWQSTGPWTMGFTAAAGGAATMSFEVNLPGDARPGQRWWALVKVMYFGRLRYSKPVWVSVKSGSA